MSQSHLLSLNSFTPLYSVAIPTKSLLHPQACSPTMDIAALVSYPIEPTSSLSMSSPVKEEATVSLWRLAGGKVWAVDLPGRVEGLGWSSDGLHLAVYLPGKLVVLSVHDGAVVKAVDISLPPPMYGFAKGKERALENVSIDWREVELPGKWPKPGQAASSAGQKRQEEVVGSVFGLLATLPLATPLEPAPTATTANAGFMSTLLPAAPAATIPPDHPLLTPALPSLLATTLPPYPPTPNSLSVLVLGSKLPFLSGSYPLPPMPIPSLLSPPCDPGVSEIVVQLARNVSAVEELLRGVVLGVERLKSEWLGQEGKKETPAGKLSAEWIETLKMTGGRMGDAIDPAGDLTRLLVSGRSNDSVSQFLGGRLTNRSLQKWESTVSAALSTIRKACFQNIAPACERIIMLLGELHGWALWPAKYGCLNLPPDVIARAIALTRYAAFRTCELEREAKEELMRFGEFTKWLRYELGVSTNEDPGSEPMFPPQHDVLLVADYLQTSFLASEIDPFLAPQPKPDAPPIDIPAVVSLPQQSLKDLISSTVAPFATPVNRNGPRLTGGAVVGPMPNIKMHSPVLSRKSLPRTSFAEHSTSDESGMMSIDETVANLTSLGSDARRNVSDPPKTHGLLEVLGELVGILRGVYVDAIPTTHGVEDANRALPAVKLLRHLQTPSKDGELAHTFVSFVDPGDQGEFLWILASSEESTSYFHCPLRIDIDETGSQPVEILDMNFFNKSEIVVVLVTSGSEDSKMLLVTIEYTALAMTIVQLPGRPDISAIWDGCKDSPHATENLPLNRCRHLSSLDRMPRGEASPDTAPIVSLALNGRPGRMTGSILTWAGREIEVFDLEEDEGTVDLEREEDGLEDDEAADAMEE